MNLISNSPQNMDMCENISPLSVEAAVRKMIFHEEVET